ncbi:MAG: phytanoyl-CoA dioxygenase family protein [Bauldia sp.]|nr:phytanoyl-CoA dioxygenase family protein [Bauldia sp.]
MAGSLTPSQIEAFKRDGCVFPITVFDDDEIARFSSAFEDYIAANRLQDPTLPPAEREKALIFPHLRLDWVYDIVTHPRVADAMESILGPDVMMWDAKLFPKAPRSTSFVAWHQDGAYMPMEPIDHVVTAWIALSPSIKANGAMQVVPGTHANGQIPHVKTFAKENLLSYGQKLEGADVTSDKVVDVELQPGQMSIHHMFVVHGSPPNYSDQARLGISVNYLVPDVIDRAERPRPARLLKGEDRFRHFESFERPVAA